MTDSKRSSTSPKISFWTAVLALALILFAVFPPFFRHHGLSFLSLELVAFALICGFLSSVLHLIPATRTRWFSSTILGAALTLLIDIQFGSISSELSLIGHLFVTTGVCVLLFPHAHRVLTAFAGVLILLSPTVATKSTSTPSHHQIERDTSLPPIVYLILDEHIGIGGISNQFVQERTKILGEYIQRGFLVYENAYSLHDMTLASMGSLLNARPTVEHAIEGNRQEGFSLSKSVLFRYWADLGYRFSIYQSEYLDYCSAAKPAVDLCITYDQYIGLDVLKPLETIDYTVTALFSRSEIAMKGRVRYNFLRNKVPQSIRPPRLPPPPTGSWAARSRVALDEMRKQALVDPEGRVFFAHLLHPHKPHIYDQECRPRRSTRSSILSSSHYMDQVLCITKQLGETLDELLSLPSFKDAVVVVHGDHGPRLMGDLALNGDKEIPQEFIIDRFSTFLAIKTPEVASGITRFPTSINSEIPAIWSIPNSVPHKPMLQLTQNLMTVESLTDRKVQAINLPDFWGLSVSMKP